MRSIKVVAPLGGYRFPRHWWTNRPELDKPMVIETSVDRLAAEIAPALKYLGITATANLYTQSIEFTKEVEDAVQ